MTTSEEDKSGLDQVPAAEKVPTPVESNDGEGEEAEGEGEILTDLYFYHRIVMWDWATHLTPIQASAVKAMVWTDALLDPFHPLQEDSEDGLTLYLGKEKDGSRRLCFSLRQVEFIQHYIHEMRLADPVWMDHLAKLDAAQAAKDAREPIEGEVYSKSHEEVGKAEYPEGQEWVPLPGTFVKGEDFVSVETIQFDDPKVFKKVCAKLRKENESIRKRNILANPKRAVSTFDQAVIDNNTDGPGLRRGGQKHLNVRSDDLSRREFRTEELIKESEEDGGKTGWGGFPMLEKAVSPVSEPDQKAGQSSGLGTEELTEAKEVEAAPASAPADGDTIQHDTNNRPTIAPTDILTSDHAMNPPPDANTQYYLLAQQALTVAALGGTSSAHRKQHPEEYDDVKAEETEGGEAEAEAEPEERKATSPVPAVLPPLGKSLFISLHVATKEADKNVVTGVGWSAVWWQAPETPKGESIPSGDSSRIEIEYEEMRDRGYYGVDDHLSDEDENAPKQHWDYLFGDTLSVTAAELDKTVRTLLKDLSKSAGGGPTYMIIHGSHRAGTLNVDAQTWYDSIHPRGWDYPSFACSQGIGQTFIITQDTATLFATIESKTHKGVASSQMTLEETAWIMFGKDEARRPSQCGHAGNDAFYNLEVMLSILTGPPLEDLRKDYIRSRKLAAKQAREGTVELDQAQESRLYEDEVESEGLSGHVNAAAVGHEEDQVEWTPPTSPELDTPLSRPPPTGGVPDDESDSEDDMIKGVYWDTGDGEVVELKEEEYVD